MLKILFSILIISISMFANDREDKINSWYENTYPNWQKTLVSMVSDSESGLTTININKNSKIYFSVDKIKPIFVCHLGFYNSKIQFDKDCPLSDNGIKEYIKLTLRTFQPDIEYILSNANTEPSYINLENIKINSK